MSKRPSGFVSALPPLHPGESVVGYLMAVACASGHTSLAGVSRELIGLDAVSGSWAFPRRLDSLHSNCRGVLPISRTLIAEHTIFPAASRFVDDATRARVSTLMGNRDGARIDTIMGFGTGGARPGLQPALCIACVESDFERYGWAYWHRDHQWPGIAVCPRHARTLFAGCGSCMYSTPRTFRARLPLEQCWCGRAHTPLTGSATYSPSAHEIGVARILSDLLDAYPAELVGRPERLAFFYRLAAQEFGFSAGQNLSVQRLVDAFVGHHGKSFLGRLNLLPNRSAPWLVNAMRSDFAPRYAVGNALMVEFFFGSVAGLQQFVEQNLVALEQVEQRSIKDGRLPRPRPVRHRLPKVATSPQLSFVLYEEPVASGGSSDQGGVLLAQSPMRSASQTELAKREDFLCESVQQRLRQFSQNDIQPTRITGRRLLSGLPGYTTALLPRSKFSRLKALVASAEESADQYKHRLALWLVRHHMQTLGVVDAVKYASRATGLGRSAIRAMYEPQFPAGGEEPR